MKEQEEEILAQVAQTAEGPRGSHSKEQVWMRLSARIAQHEAEAAATPTAIAADTPTAAQPMGHIRPISPMVTTGDSTLAASEGRRASRRIGWRRWRAAAAVAGVIMAGTLAYAAVSGRLTGWLRPTAAQETTATHAAYDTAGIATAGSGTIAFHDTPLGVIADSLEAIYAVRIAIADEALAATPFTITVDTSEPATEAIRALAEAGGFRYETENDRCLIHR